jgi:nucleoside-diphosphate-sugar epimerase
MSRVLITGAAGFVGLHLARLHASLGDHLTLVDNFFRGEADADLAEVVSGPNVDFLHADLTLREAWSDLGDDHDYVYHLAAINGTGLFYRIPHEVLRVNLLTTIHALDWFRSNKVDGKILFASSSEAYAGGLEAFGELPIPTPETVPLVIADVGNPRWSYAGTKVIGEQLFLHYGRACDPPPAGRGAPVDPPPRVVVVRPHNFYGPRAGYGHVIPQFIERIVRRVDPFPIHGADETRAFCYVADAVEALRGLMVSRVTDGGIFHVGAADETVIGDLAAALFAVDGWRPTEIRAERSPAGSVKRRLPDVRRIRDAIGWEATTPLADGLRTTFAWYVDRLRQRPPGDPLHAAVSPGDDLRPRG